MIIDLSREVARHHSSGRFEVIQPIPGDNHAFLSGVLGEGLTCHYLSRSQKHHGERYSDFDVPSASLAVQAAHLAFDQHLGLTIRPDTLWYMIVSQVAEFIKLHPYDYAFMFTTTPGQKQKIKVRDDSLVYGSPDNDWGRTIGLFQTPLRAAVTDDTANLFLAQFSTTTPEDKVAILVTFMDAASPYYEFEVVTLCGITSVQLLGIQEDYEHLQDKARRLANAFPALEDYFSALIPVLGQIAQSFDGAPDPEFWNSLYHYQSGSGISEVTGWINAFQIFQQTADGLLMKEDFNWDHRWSSVSVNTFPSHVSKVDFTWNYYGKEIPMTFVAGIIGVDYSEGHLDPRLGFGVYEVTGK